MLALLQGQGQGGTKTSIILEQDSGNQRALDQVPELGPRLLQPCDRTSASIAQSHRVHP